MDIIYGSTFGGTNKYIKIAGTDISAIGDFKREHTPFLSFTLSKEQMIQLRNYIDDQLGIQNEK